MIIEKMCLLLENVSFLRMQCFLKHCFSHFYLEQILIEKLK